MMDPEMRARDTTPESHSVQLEIYRRLGPSARASLAGELSAATRQLTRSGIRGRHPEYTERDVDLALFRLLYGDDLFQRAWPGLPLLAS
jgi:hypothetical protein